MTAVSTRQFSAISSGRVAVKYCGPGCLQSVIEMAGIHYFHRADNILLDGPLYDDAVVDEIAKLESLQSISLYRTRISQEGVKRLKRELPNCRIEQEVQLDEAFWKL